MDENSTTKPFVIAGAIIAVIVGILSEAVPKTVEMAQEYGWLVVIGIFLLIMFFACLAVLGWLITRFIKRYHEMQSAHEDALLEHRKRKKLIDEALGHCEQAHKECENQTKLLVKDHEHTKSRLDEMHGLFMKVIDTTNNTGHLVTANENSVN